MEEGSTLLPALRQTADAKELDRLGRAFEQRRAEELKALSGSASGSPDGATKAELHEQAQQADVPGRSQMDKQELARALKKAGS